MYLIQKTLIWFNNHFFLLSKYLFIVSKCLVGSIQINIYLKLVYFFLSAWILLHIILLRFRFLISHLDQT